MGIENAIIEGNLVFGLAESAPVFAIDGRVHYCLRGAGASPDTFLVKNKRILVKEGPLLETLEKLSDKKLEKKYAAYQEELIAKELKGKEDSNIGNNRLIRFVVTEIFPHLRKADEKALNRVLDVDESIEKDKKTKEMEMKEKIDGKKGSYEKEIEAYVADRLKEMEKKDKCMVKKPKADKLESILFNQNLSKTAVNNSIFYSLTGGFNFAFVSGTAYILANVKNNGELFVNGRAYNLVTFAYTENIADSYASEKIKRLSIDALTTRLKESREFLRLKMERQDIDEVCRKENYHEQDFGFIKKNNHSAIVYVDVPDYVLQEPGTDNLYKFRGHRLGIELYDEDGRIQLYDDPFALSDVGGPFYGGNTDLCMGDYSKVYLERMDKGRGFAKLLTDARNVVLRGYQRGCNPRSDLCNYTHRRISLAEVRRQGLEITNINIQKRRRKSENGEDEYD